MNTRLRTAPAVLRLGAVGLLLAVALPLSACGFPFSPYSGGAVAVGGDDSPPPSTPPTSSDAPAADGTGFTFDEPTPAAGAQIGWSDRMLSDSSWTIDALDDGNGNWSYKTTDGVCVVKFWQGTVSATGAADDRAASDLMLAALTQATIADVTAAAEDVPLKNASTGARDVDTRAVQGENGAATWVIQARAFRTAGLGVSYVLDCTDGSAVDVARTVIANNPVQIIG